MTDLESGRARELVGRAGDQAPPMPDFDSIVALAERARPASKSAEPHRRVMALATVGVLMAAGSVFWWSARGQDPEQIISGSQEAPSPTAEPTPPTVEPAAWTRDSFPVLAGIQGLELSYALDSTRLSNMTVYADADGLTVTIEVLTAGAVGREADPPSAEIEVNGSPGSLHVSSGDNGAGSTSVSWVRDGFQFFLTIEGSLSTDEAIELAERVVPATKDDLGTDVISSAGLVGAERFDVATATANGEQFTLQAATSTDGSAFSLSLDRNGGGGGTDFLLPGTLVSVHAGTSRAYRGLAVSGLVDQSVASLRVRLSDGSSQPVDIQSRSLGFDAAFFLTIIEAPAGATITLEAYSADGALMEAVEFAGSPYPLDLEVDNPETVSQLVDGAVVLPQLGVSIDEFVVDTLGWELTEVTVQESGDGAALIVADSHTEPLRVTPRADGGGISAVAPNRRLWQVGIAITDNSFGISFQALGVDAASATLYVATDQGEIETSLTKEQINERWVTVDVPGLTDQADIDYLVVFEDESGRVISALSTR